jgi:hypothetical protein
MLGMKSQNEEEVIRQAMSFLGARTSEKKTLAARANGHAGGRPKGSGKPLSEIMCNCSATEDSEHKATCPRGRAYRRRMKAVAK